MINLKDFVKDIPNHLQKKLTIENEDKLEKSLKSVVVCGMGGSGVIGNLSQYLFPEINIDVHKDYGLAKNADINSLFIIISYSGNTEETLSSFDEAQKNNYKVAVISGGGRLLEKAKEAQVPYVEVPQAEEIPTRFNTGILTRAILEIFEASGFLSDLDSYVSPVKKLTEFTAGISAEQFLDKTVLIYSSPELKGLGEVWKEALNETAKLPAFVNTLPEISHNEIESINTIENPLLIFLRDPQSEDKVKESFSSFEKIAKEKEWDYKNIIFEDEERIVDLAKNIIFAFETSIDIAKLKGVDPKKTPLIEKTKNN